MATDNGVESPGRLSHFPLQAITNGLTIALLHVAGLSIMLAAAEVFGISSRQTMTLIVVIHGFTALLSAGFTFYFRIPLVIGINATSLFFIISLASTFSYREVMGGVLVGGILVVLVAMLGLSARLTTLIPAPIVFGTVAGAVFPFVAGIFTDMTTEPAMIGSTVLAFLAARRLFSSRFPAVLPALAIGALVAFLSNKLDGANEPWTLPTITTAWPVFSWHALLAIAPVVAILVSANANLASIIYLRSQGYDPPERAINIGTGIATTVGGLFGSIPISLGAFIMPLVASPEAGERHQRLWGPYAASVGMLMIVLLAGIAAQIPAMIPSSLLLAIAGLVLVAVLGQMLGGALSGPLKLGPLFAFAVAASDMALWGFGSAFWALVIGMLVTMLLERQELIEIRQSVPGAAS